MKNSYDLIIIGSGVSGMTSAIRAVENGVKNVLILEKSPYIGGNSRAAGGVFATSGKTISAVGAAMDTQAYYEQAMKQLQYSVNPGLVHKYIFNTGDALDWLADTGLKFEVKRMPFGCTMATIEDEALAEPYKKTAPTSHSYMGTAMVQKLKEICAEKGIDILTSAPAKELLTNENGAISGVRAATKTEEFTFATRAVILATGGVAGTVASLSEFFPHLFDLDDENFTFGSVHCVGDGIRMAEKLGADTRQAMGVLLKGPSHLGPGGTQALTYSADSMIVTQLGYRFINEQVIFDYHAALNNIPGKTTYTIADADIVNEMNAKMPPSGQPGTNKAPVTLLEGLQQEVDSGKGNTFIGDSLEEAAAFFGIPEENLMRAVAEYNAMCEAGKDTLLGKDPRHLKPIKKAPFYVLKGIRSTDSTYGGVRINENFEAVRPDGSIIQGLYAVGDVATGFVAEIYAPPGAGFTWSLNSGHMCGKVVAEALV